MCTPICGEPAKSTQVLLVADQEEARKQCRERAARFQTIKARFPTADYYRFYPELSGPERARRFGDAPVRAGEPR